LEVLESLHALQKALVEHLPEREVKGSLRLRVGRRGDRSFELFRQRIPVVNRFEETQPL
jgi:hypothetical protein